MSRFRTLMPAAVIAAVIGSLTLTSCSSAEPVEMTESTVVIDVRTPQEFAEGHLDGAVNIDLQSGVFEQQISQLDAAGDYLVYCRSGNRSGQAAQIMGQLGFENVVNLGSVQAASDSTGIAIVR